MPIPGAGTLSVTSRKVENREPDNKHFVLARLTDGTVLFRQYHSEDGITYLKALYPVYPPVKAGFEVLGRVFYRGNDL